MNMQVLSSADFIWCLTSQRSTSLYYGLKIFASFPAPPPPSLVFVLQLSQEVKKGGKRLNTSKEQNIGEGWECVVAKYQSFPCKVPW